MRHKRQHKPLCIIINSFLYYYYRKVEIISNYKCTFGLKEDESASVTQKRMPSQREQYGGTVHLFIGTGHSPYKITFMPFTFGSNSIVIHRGLNSLFIFKSVSFSGFGPPEGRQSPDCGPAVGELQPQLLKLSSAPQRRFMIAEGVQKLKEWK